MFYARPWLLQCLNICLKEFQNNNLQRSATSFGSSTDYKDETGYRAKAIGTVVLEAKC